MNNPLKKLCTPSRLYLVISLVAFLIMALQNVGNVDVYCLGNYYCDVTSTVMVFIIKLIYILFWTWILDLICKAGYTNISWFLLLLPVILLFIIIVLVMIS